MSAGCALILMPTRVFSMAGSGQARLRGPTNGFAAPHETRNHLVGSLVVEASRTFVNKDNPIWDGNGINRDSVNPSKCVISWPRFIDMKMDTHIPCTVLWLLYAINASHSLSEKGGSTYNIGLLGCRVII